MVFACFIYSIVIVRYFLEFQYGGIGVAVLAYLGYETGKMVWLPFSIQAGMTAALFVYLGWIAKKYRLFEKLISPVWISGAAIVWLFGVLFCGEFYLVRNYFGHGFFDIIVAVAGSYLVIIGCKIIDQKAERLARLLQFYGKNTLIILCMHSVELLIVSWDWVWKIGGELQLQAYQVIGIILILKTMLFSVGIYVIHFLKNKYNILKNRIRERKELWKKKKIAIETRIPVENTRIKYMDMAKGITIMAMILGHVQIPEYLRIIIFSFHMPLFMIINGYFIKNYSIKRTFIRSVRTLLVPYTIVCLISAGIYAYIAIESNSVSEMFFYKIKAMIGGMSKISNRFLSFDSVCVVWFICCLFLARNIYVMLINLSKKCHWICPYGILVLAFGGYMIGKYYAFMPWSLDVALVCLIFIGIGNWLRRESFFDKSYSYILIIPATVWIYFMKMGISIELAVRSYPFGIFCIIEAIAGSIVVISISKLLNKNKIMTAILSWVGKNSMIILGIHCLELMYFNWDNYIFAYLPFTMNWFRIFVIKSIVILFLTGVIVVIKNWIRVLTSKEKCAKKY